MTDVTDSRTNGITSGATLLPCGHCGGDPEPKWRYRKPGEDACYWVHCPTCGMSTKAFATEAEAIAAWNTRSVTAAAVMGYEAAQAERTCTNASYRLDESRFHCSECGFGCWVKDVADGRDKLPTYCPNCGAKVIGG